MTKWDSKGSHSENALSWSFGFPSIYKIYINKTHSLEVSKKRNAALTTSINMLSDFMLIVKCQCQYAVSFCSSVIIIINIIMLLGVCVFLLIVTYAECHYAVIAVKLL